MRSCIYCGRDLADGEQCSCPSAVARRTAKSGQNTQTDRNTKDDSHSGYYRTGYTQNDGAFKRAWDRMKTKRAARKRNAQANGGAREIFSYIWRFIKSPATEIANPRDFSLWQMLLIAAAQGAIIGLCIYFILTGESRGWFKTLANIIGFGGINGYKALIYAGVSAVSGAAGGIIFFLAHAGVFWLINRFIFRSYTGFTSFSQRLILTNIPFTVLAAVGVAFAFISSTTLMILLMCGALSSFILTYISLSEEWSSYSGSRVMYSMMLGYFILFTFIFSLLRVSVIGG